MAGTHWFYAGITCSEFTSSVGNRFRSITDQRPPKSKVRFHYNKNKMRPNPRITITVAGPGENNMVIVVFEFEPDKS
ncbi:MAG: hypothetical protein CM1200mP18_16600 [Gammaproteobacteria bacterium]|nr:MAG: hypothetical protein CM1200mP18_16600 [Gammaproteobacteria bacterium]